MFCPDNNQLASAEQAGRWKWWVGPGNEHQVHLGRLMLDEICDSVQHMLVVDIEKIIQYEYKPAGMLEVVFSPSSISSGSARDI